MDISDPRKVIKKEVFTAAVEAQVRRLTNCTETLYNDTRARCLAKLAEVLPEGLDRIDAELRLVYAAAGKPEHWKLFRQDVQHVETPEMRAEAVGWLKRHLS